MGLCCLTLLTLFKSKCIQIPTLFMMLNSEIEYFFKIKDPINLYHAERHILIETNVEVPPPPLPPPAQCRCPSVNSQGNHFPCLWRQETVHLLMMTYHQDIMTNFICVCDRYTVIYPFFRAVYQNMHKHTCPCERFKVFMLKINFTTK